MRNLQITQAITNRENKSVEAYFKEIEKQGLITAEEEVILAQKIRQGDQAAHRPTDQSQPPLRGFCRKKYQYQGLPLMRPDQRR
jgi:RNA polymerase primary sigma factor